jgi:Flp pilus assembly protein TadG
VSARERGSVTAELAIALPAVTLLLAAVLVLGSAASGQLRCADAARAGARAAAIGEDPSEIVAIANRVAGAGASVGVDVSGVWVTVTVGRSVLAGPFAGGPLRAQASAVARVEP